MDLNKSSGYVIGAISCYLSWVNIPSDEIEGRNEATLTGWAKRGHNVFALQKSSHDIMNSCLFKKLSAFHIVRSERSKPGDEVMALTNWDHRGDDAAKA